MREPSGSFAFVSGNTVRRLAADLSSITLIAGESDSAAPRSTTDSTGVTLGGSPTLGGSGALVATCVKRLVLISDDQLLQATLP